MVDALATIAPLAGILGGVTIPAIVLLARTLRDPSTSEEKP